MNGEDYTENMNSVLFEGIVTGAPAFGGAGKETWRSFLLSAWKYRYEGANKELCFRQESPPCVAVMLHGDLAVEAEKKALRGKIVRAAGKLAANANGNIYIEAEHIGYVKEPGGRLR
jgi:hypothetical protein